MHKKYNKGNPIRLNIHPSGWNNRTMPSKSRKQDIEVNVGGNVTNSTIIIGDRNAVSSSTTGGESIGARFRVPFPHNPDFVGRDEELSSLHELLQQKQSIVGIRPTVLVGLGGIGKTQLAVEYAHAHRDDYPSGVFWLNAIHPLLIEFSDLAEKLEMSDRDTPRDKAARKAWDYLDAHPDALVIFDNVLEPSELNLPFSPDLIPANLRCRTLFTTRQRDFPRTFQPFEVKVLPEMSAMRLLLRARPKVLEERHPEWGWARIVCAYLGWLPLALELAAAYLGAYPEVSITGYLERLRTEGSLETVDASEVRAVDLPTRVEEILKAAAAGNLESKHQVAVSATLQTQWKRLDDDDARLLFRAAGQFPEASWIPIPRLGLLTGIESDAKPGRPSPLNVVLKKLHAVSLIEELSDDRLRLHPLVQEFAARLSPAPAPFHQEMAERVAAEFDDLLRLQARVIHYGVDMALEDVRTGLGFCIDKPETETYVHLSKMERVLDRQAHYLRGWDTQAQPAFFMQQLRSESFQLDLDELQARAEAKLTQLGNPYLRERFKVSRESPELVRTLTGHSDNVCGVALSADGRVAVSVSDDHTLIVWDVATGLELHMLKGHSAGVTDVVLSADRRLAVSASGDTTLKVWDLATGRELRTLQGHSAGVGSVALSADGRLAISASGDMTLKVWDVATGWNLRTLKGHKGRVAGVALSADGRLAVSVSPSEDYGGDDTIRVWDVATGCELCASLWHMGVTSVALSADGQIAVSASRNKTLKVWDISALLNAGLEMVQELRTLQGHSDAVLGVALSTDGRLAVSASRDKTLKVWDVATGRELHTLQGHSYDVSSVALSADGRLIISASSDQTLKVWNISASLDTGVVTGRELRMLGGHSGLVDSVALSADGRLAASVSVDKTLKVWDVETGCELHTLQWNWNWMRGVALSPDGRLVVSTSGSELKMWVVATGRELHTSQEYSDYLDGVALSVDWWLGGIARESVIFYVCKMGKTATNWECLRFDGHSHSVIDVALSADGRLAISASQDKTLKVWDVASRCELHTIQEHSNGLALSADGRLAVSASRDKTLKVWDVVTGRELRTLTGHSDGVQDVALSADGRLAVSASCDMTLKVWDMATGRVLSTFPTIARLHCCAITPDGKTIVAGDEIGMIHFLELVGIGEVQAPEVKL